MPALYSAACCLHCKGTARHAKWCFTANRRVRYAFEAATGHSPLSEGDSIILRALGVLWEPRNCC